MVESYEFHKGRRPDRTYVSKSFTETGSDRRKRVLYKVFDGEQHTFGTLEDELVLHERRERGRVEVQAVFYEDDRRIERVTIIKFERDQPHARYQYRICSKITSATLRVVPIMPRIAVSPVNSSASVKSPPLIRLTGRWGNYF